MLIFYATLKMNNEEAPLLKSGLRCYENEVLKYEYPVVPGLAPGAMSLQHLDEFWWQF